MTAWKLFIGRNRKSIVLDSLVNKYRTAPGPQDHLENFYDTLDHLGETLRSELRLSDPAARMGV